MRFIRAGAQGSVRSVVPCFLFLAGWHAHVSTELAEVGFAWACLQALRRAWQGKTKTGKTKGTFYFSIRARHRLRPALEWRVDAPIPLFNEQ